MALFDRTVLGAAIAAVPSALVSILLVPWGYHLLLFAIFLVGTLIGAALAACRVQPFPWLESKLPVSIE